MKTDYLDLWQCHEVVTHAEVDKIFGPNGSLEAFVKANRLKVRSAMPGSDAILMCLCSS